MKTKTTMMISGSILAVAAVGQVALSILLYREDGNTLVRNLGWGVMWISALLGWLPMLTLKRHGGVEKGKSYVQTTVLVDRGIYGIVRHPQYTAGILLGIGLSMIAQHWAVWALGAVVAILSYSDTLREDHLLRDKFGQAYENYSRRVPRVNFVFGILRWLRRRVSFLAD